MMPDVDTPTPSHGEGWVTRCKPGKYRAYLRGRVMHPNGRSIACYFEADDLHVRIAVWRDATGSYSTLDGRDMRLARNQACGILHVTLNAAGIPRIAAWSGRSSTPLDTETEL